MMCGQSTPSGHRHSASRGGGCGHGHGSHGFRGRQRGSDDDTPRGARRARLFGPGDLRLLMLHVLAERPGHGYEVIKAIENLVGGDYSPSPGTIYPTLTLLEDIGSIQAAMVDGDRRQYRITDAGREQLAAQHEALTALLARLGTLRDAAGARRSAPIQRAMQNLKTALHLRFDGGAQSEEQLRRIAEAIDRAAVEIERL